MLKNYHGCKTRFWQCGRRARRSQDEMALSEFILLVGAPKYVKNGGEAGKIVKK